MQMSRIILLSLTPRQYPGGVARWVNDFIAAFPDKEVIHFSIEDLFARFGQRDINEWDAAITLGRFLRQKQLVNEEDTFVVDGFWGMGLPHGSNVISVCHGTWARRVKSDLDKGIPSEFPYAMEVQKRYWNELVDGGGKIVAVSDFAQWDLKETWGLPSEVINNAIDGKIFSPKPRIYRTKPIIIHGVTSKVKSIDHINYLKAKIPNADIWLLDEAAQKLNMPKYEALAQADVVAIPSHYEGNSYFTLEALSVGVPIVCYDVGMPWWAYRNGFKHKVGDIIPYEEFGVQRFLDGVNAVLSEDKRNLAPDELASLFTPERFRSEWKDYLEKQGR
jgi:glycosyltransferase involved in cell wall biosynthesis